MQVLTYYVLFYTFQLLLMLVIDAFLTVLTWMPEVIYFLMIIGGFKEDMEAKIFWTISVVLQGLSLTNVFSTPIVYYLFNNNFKVNKKIITY